MHKQKAIVDFSKFKDNDLVVFAQGIESKMTNNPDFTKPTPALAVIQTAINEYSAAIAKAHDGTKQDTAVKNDKKKILAELLAKLAAYVNGVANGDIAKLDGSGIPLTKLPATVGILPAPENFTVTTGDISGVAYLEMKKVPKAKGYVALYAKSPAPADRKDWQSLLFTKTKDTVTGLESGKKYLFMVAAASTESSKTGLYNFTQPIEKFIP